MAKIPRTVQICLSSLHLPPLPGISYQLRSARKSQTLWASNLITLQGKGRIFPLKQVSSGILISFSAYSSLLTLTKYIWLLNHVIEGHKDSPWWVIKIRTGQQLFTILFNNYFELFNSKAQFLKLMQNYIQYLIITYNGKESEKKYMYN